MRYWMYVEPVCGKDPEPVYTIYSEKAILAEGWDSYKTIAKAHGKETTEEQCIQDWVTVHWAVELTNEFIAQFVSND